MRRTPIRMKLGIALAVPLLGLFLITMIEVASIGRDVDDVRHQTALARAAIGPSGLITSLQNERTWAVTQLVGQETAIQPPVVGYEETRADTDQALAEFRDTLGDDTEAAAAYDAPLELLNGLDELRTSIDETTNVRDLSNIEFADEIYAGYADLILPFFEANTALALEIEDADLRQASQLIDTASRQMDTVADLARMSIIEIALRGGLDEPTEIAAIYKLRAVFDEANAVLQDAGAPYDAIVEATFPGDLVTNLSDAIDADIAGEDVNVAAILEAVNVPADAGYAGVRDRLVAALNDRSDQLNADARNRERVFIAMAVTTLAAGIVLSWIVTRSITKPLRALTRQAKEMAERRLPHAVIDILETPLGENITVPHVDPVRVRASDEVADVAAALNTVQDTALDLAVEQAVLRRNIADSFVNLGRRNQNLLGRQLDFITELETNEADADALSNLFRLDHLATRMRRNAESLLVLAGVEPPRQWAAPVRLTDVIRAALGEVEDYQRVTVRGVEPATIIGSAAADLAHLMAELIENALVFSPPDQAVDIRGRNRTDGGYTLAIIDAGLGMAQHELAAANRRLAGAESFTIAPSKYLGHYVAGNLAARHHIGVHLDNSPSNGITATITVPAAVLTSDEVTAAPVTPPHGHQLRSARALQEARRPDPGGRAPRSGTGTAPDTGDAPGRPIPLAPAPLPPPAPRLIPDPPMSTGAPSAARGFTPPDATPVVGPSRDGGHAPLVAPGNGPTPAPRHAPAAGATGGSLPSAMAPPPGRPAAGDGGGGLWPRAMPLGGGPRPRRDAQPGATGGAGPATPLPTTASGLARRAPAESTPGATPAGPPVDDALLAALGRVATGGSGAGRPAPPARDTATAAGPAAAGMPFPPPDALARRVRGAQMPRATVVALHGSRSPQATEPAPRMARGASKAADVQTLLPNFAAGVQRGLAETGERAPRSGEVPVVGAHQRSGDRR